MGRPATKRRSRALRQSWREEGSPRPVDACASWRSDACARLRWATYWRGVRDFDSARALVLSAAKARAVADDYFAHAGRGVLP